jgi:hypothetical protein
MFTQILFSPLMNTTQDVVKGFIGVLGFILCLAITAALIFFLRKPLAQLIGKLISDEEVAKKLALFITILLGLAGLYSAVGALYPDNYGALFTLDDKFRFGQLIHLALFGLLDLLRAFAGVLQWAVLVVAVFFVGFAVKKS